MNGWGLKVKTQMKAIVKASPFKKSPLIVYHSISIDYFGFPVSLILKKLDCCKKISPAVKLDQKQIKCFPCQRTEIAGEYLMRTEGLQSFYQSKLKKKAG